MNDDSLKKFLKENATPVPAPLLGENSRIWRHIETGRNRRKMWWTLGPIFATAAALVLVVHTQTLQSESAKIEEDYLYQEWNAMMSEVNSDVDSELITTFEK